MEQFTVVSIGNLNLREGPGEAFEIINQVPGGYKFKVVDSRKDGGGHRWYKTNINDGWVKSVYVAQPETIEHVKNRIKSEKNTASFVLGSVVEGIANKAGSALGTLIGGVGGLAALGNFLGGNSSTVQDRIMSRRIFGVPHQFIDTTDMRPDDGSALGIEFMNNIMAETPILSILPGIPDYLADMDQDKKIQLTTALSEAVNEALTTAGMQRIEESNLDTKFFEFAPRCMEYMTYVNVLARMGAIFLGLGQVQVPGYGEYNYGNFNWFRWHLSNAYAGKKAPGNDFTQVAKSAVEDLGIGVDAVEKWAKNNFEDAGEMLGFLKKQEEEADGDVKIKKDEDRFKSANQLDSASLNVFYMDSYYIDFFIKPPSYQDSFQNSTSQSRLAGAIQGASDMAKELQFILGGAMSVETGKLNEQVGNFNTNMNNLIKSTEMNENMKKIMSSLITGSTSVITGANLIFPEIWESSNYSRDFSMEMTFSTPYATRESYFLNIWVPMSFLLALVLPRQTTVNSYSAPFLVRATVPGFFSCDMGIVKDVSITKGGPSGDNWSKDGLPTEVNVTINIADLYNALSMSNYRTPKNIWNFLWNTPLLDYVGVACGLNMRSSEYDKKITLIKALTKNWASDQFDYTWGSVGEQAAVARTRILGAKG